MACVAVMLVAAWVLPPGVSGQARERVLVIPQHRTMRVAGGRVDADRAEFRAVYGARPELARSVEFSAPGERVLEAAGRIAGREFDERRLVRESDRVIDGVRYLRWRQVEGGVPVLDRSVAASVDRNGHVSFVLNGIDESVAGLSTRPAVLPAAAREIARGVLDGVPGRVGSANLVILPGPKPALAWQVFVWPDGEPAEWRILVDARDGQVIGVRDETVTKRGRGSAASIRIPFASPERSMERSSIGAAGSIDGQGLVFDPDPLATSGAAYGPPYVDANDADSPELRAERRSVTLRDITIGTDGMHRLEGPFVRIVGENSAGRTVYAPPAEASASGFAYSRSDDGFEAVSAYYHLDASQRYVQSLGFHDLQSTPLPVNPAGTTSDDSGWIAALRYIFFGTGGVDDAEDAFVLWHEYAHALLEAGAPGLRTTLEGQALHEGWSDYWAASYGRFLAETGATRRTDWRRAFRWDAGDGQIWAGRMLDFQGRYPEDTCSDNASPGACSPHNDGRLWATVLLEIYDVLGRTVTDRLNLLSHRYLVPPVTFPDAAAALIQADVDHYGGAHLSVLVPKLAARGLVDSGQFAPVASHQALPDTESLGTGREVRVHAVGVSAPVSEVTLFYRYGSGAQSSVDMMPAGSDEYAATMPLPSVPGDVRYWVRVLDAANRVTVLPPGAPTTTFGFHAGPDTTPPTIEHTAVSAVSLADWPVTIAARISDALGVAGAAVEYSVRDGRGQPVANGTILLAPGDGVYAGTFDVPAASMSAGSTVSYRIRAVDASVSGNVAWWPDSGFHEFAISAAGLVRVLDADEIPAGTSIGGAWMAGPSTYAVTASPSAGAVWGVGLDGPYEPRPEVSRLRFERMDLTGLGAAWLVLRHWFETTPDGDSGSTTFLAGGNVKVSTDGGASWRMLEPVGGYPGVIGATGQNPIAGEAAYGGASRGWKFAVFALPIARDVRLAFDFGTGTEPTGASRRGGWRIDAMTVATWVPLDEHPPDVLELPEAVTLVAVEASDSLRLAVSATDDVALADVRVEYRVVRSGIASTGTYPLAVSAGDVTRFETTLAFDEPLSAGDRVEYRFRLVDEAGRERLAPPLGEDPLRFEVRVVTTTDLLAGARASGSFVRSGSAWTTGTQGGSLVSLPVTIAANQESAHLEVSHTYRLDPSSAARLLVSQDDGLSWALAEPEGGYPSMAAGLPAWNGTQAAERRERFPLAGWAGRTVVFRFENAVGTGGPDDRWTLVSARIVQTTASAALDLGTRAALHANFPDPFAGLTSISFFLPEPLGVVVEVYDVLGRRVGILADAVFAAGSHGLAWDASTSPAGVYFIRMRAGAQSFVEPAVVRR